MANKLGFSALARRYASRINVGLQEDLVKLIQAACTEAAQPSSEREAIIQFLRNESIIRFEGFPEQSRVLAWAANEISAGKHIEHKK